MYVHVPLSWFAAASRLPGKAAIIASLFYLQADLQRGDLWRNDRLDEHRHVECDCDRDQLSYRWGVHVLSSSGSANVITATATCRLAKGSEGTPVDTGVDALI